MMNERIQELAKQAEQYALDRANEGSDEDYDYAFDDDFREKFAELVVRECANIDFRHKVGMTTDQEFETGCVILEHFGVEE